MPAPDFVASATNSGLTSPATVVIPTSGPEGSVAAGMRALLVLTITPSAPTAAPTGFIAVADTYDESTQSGGHMYLWEGETTSAGAVDAGDTITVPLDGSGRWALALYIAEDSAINLPVGVYAPVPPISGDSGGALASPTATAADESRVVHIYGVNSYSNGQQPTWTAHASTTERADVTSTHGSSRNATIFIADELQSTPGTTTSRVATSSVRVQPSAFTVVLADSADRPTATPGAPQTVAAGQEFTLTVTAAGGAGGPYTYQWRQISGTTTALDDDEIQEPSGTAGSVSETLVYGVIVTDNDGVESFEAEAQVTVLGAADTSVPVANVTVTGWTAEPSGAIYEVLADTTDGSYAAYVNPVGTVVLEVEMSALNEPEGSEPYTVSWRPSMVAATAGSAMIRLKQGASTIIASWGPDTWSTADSVQQFDHQLTAPQVASVTDWTDLRVRIEATVS